MEFWWIALIVLAAAIGLAVAAWSLRNHRKLSMQILFALSVFLLVFKTTEFAAYRAVGKALYPVEFSHISYFVLGAVMVSGVKKLRPFAGILSLVSGAAFVVAAIASPDSIHNDAFSVYFMIVSITQHLLLFFAGVMLLFNFDKYSIKDIWMPIVGAAVIVVFSVLVYNRIIYKDFANRDNMVIIDIVTGNILKYVLPVGDTVAVWLKAIVIVGILIVVLGVFVAYYLINNKFFEIREKKGLPLKDVDYELGIAAAVKYFMRDKKIA